uniref:Uncharacterized protein n=1 Tax=Quercus lobata TaxID=97700 RepID=A0A7N2M1A0_QUELO
MARYQVHLITNLANFEGSIGAVAGLVVTHECSDGSTTPVSERDSSSDHRPRLSWSVTEAVRLDQCCDSNGNNNDKDEDKNSAMSFAEARRLMRFVNVEACESMGVARSAAFVQVLDEVGVILLFRDKVYLHPDKVEVSLNQQHLCREAKIGPKAHKL